LTTQNGMLDEVKRNLKQCGYSDPLLQADYFYEDGLGKHTVPLAGFASPVHDARTSCVSVIVSEDFVQVRPEHVNKYRGLGAPAAFVCCNGTTQWWSIRREGAEWKGTFNKAQLDNLFAKQKEDFKPDRLWRAKNLGRLDKDQQLRFVDVDIGLMPLLEDEMGECLGDLMKRVISSLERGFTEGQLKEACNKRWVFQAAFWLLCAKILRDKRVDKFASLNLADIDAVLKAVITHYGAQDKVEVKSERQRRALEEAASLISAFASLSNLTTEAFGYMYENLLVDKELRAALGIHATPSYLVDYIVWQLLPWIEQIPQEKRIILEPACGHAPFLTSAMRMLRFLYRGRESSFHEYAKGRLVGIELDSFAREIARLSLTMADVPNSNGWNISEGDIYRSNVLRDKAKNATILLCNPPFEDFRPEELDDLKNVGVQLRFRNKAAEMLWRTLPHMLEGGVFGVILPRGFLNKDNLAPLRKMIISDFEIQQICHLPKKVFRHAAHESVVLSGRKKISRADKNRIRENRILYKHVSKDGLKKFQERYAGEEQYVTQSIFLAKPLVDLRLRELPDVWDYCEGNFSKLDSISEGGQGLSYKRKDVLGEAMTFDKRRFSGARRGFVWFNDNIVLHGLPEEFWMSLAKEVIDRSRWGSTVGQPQVLMNYAPVSAGPWRLKALIDREGRPVMSRFLVFRITNSDWSLCALWAVLNGPLANAFIYAHATDREIPAGTARRIPVPHCSKESLEKVERLVAEYFGLMEKGDCPFGVDLRDAARRTLLSIDAEVLRLYDLPPKMEKRVLDLFQGIQRQGVDFEFRGYYPEGFESAVPLYELLSEEYQRSTVSFVKKWVEDNRTPEIIKVFEKSLEAFEGQ
jgi:hypothetical protein